MRDPLSLREARKAQTLVCYHADMDPAAWDAEAFGVSFEAVHLFEAMPTVFRFDELTGQANKHGLSASESVDLLREWQACEMVAFDGERFTKTGQKPYF